MLDAFFRPRQVAVIGASTDPESAGHAVFRNLHGTFEGAVHPVNIKGGELLGVPLVEDVADLPEGVDMAAICIPLKYVPGMLPTLADKGVKALVVISAGGQEAGAAGADLEEEIARTASELGMRTLGPNCLGMISTGSRLNASFAAAMPPAGSIGFFSQSGALCTAILDWALDEEVGFSHFVSLGNKADLTELDFLEAMAADPGTRVILGYVEQIGDGRAFVERAAAISREKPIILVKSGTSEAGARAASSHTGSLTGSEHAVAAALRRAGVVRARGVQELFDLAVAFSSQPLPAGRRLAVVTNAGGPGIITADACGAHEVELPAPGEACLDRLREVLPPIAGLNNPIDIIGDATPDRYAATLEVLVDDPGYDGLLVLCTPQAMTELEETAAAVDRSATSSEKPHLAAFMGEASLDGAKAVLRAADDGRGVPRYAYPERAVRVFQAMADHAAWRRLPADEPPDLEVDPATAREVIDRARADGRLDLGEKEARTIIEAYGLGIPEGELARTADEAVAVARRLGYPVACKLSSPEILHKSDVGGVALDLASDEEVRRAFEEMTARARGALIWGVLVQEMVAPGKEVIIGVTRDPSFGPVLMFGLGGIYVEVLEDVTYRLAPVGPREAREMTEEIRAAALLRGARGETPCDIEAVVDAILRVSRLVTDHPDIVELDVNPLVVWPEGARAIDARLTVTPDGAEGAPAGRRATHHEGHREGH